jgi:signal transduction histidine kinase/CheY-like chemotaxis protein
VQKIPIRQFLLAVICGLSSLTLYLFEAQLLASIGLESFNISIAHIFIIIAALTLMPHAVILALTLGTFSITTQADTSTHLALQAAVITSLILIQRKYLPAQVPPLASLLAWSTILIPLKAITGNSIWPTDIGSQHLGLQCFIDTILTGLCASTLLIPYLWEKILNRPINNARDQVLGIIFSSIISITALCVLLISLTAEATFFISLEAGLALSIFIVSLSILAVELTGRSLEKLTSENRLTKLSGSLILVDSQEKSFQKPKFIPKDPGLDDEPEQVLTDIRPPGVCAITADHTVIFINDRFRELTGTQNRIKGGVKLNQINMNSAMQSQIEDCICLVQEGESRVFEIKMNELPEQLKFYSLAVDPHAVDNNKQGFLITLQEITDRRTIESHLLASQKMKNLGSIMGSIAHAFNNYLTSVIGRASFALRINDSATNILTLQEILNHSRKAAELVWRLLRFSEGKPSSFEFFPVQDLLQEHMEFFRKIVGSNYNLTFSSDVKSSSIKGDENLILQIMTELVTNARESYRGKSGEIDISLAEESIETDITHLYQGAKAGEYLRLTVKDRGAGMSPEMLDQAFAPLETTHERPVYKGLGLAIVYTIARAHDGFLSIESFPEKGTKVSVYLPLANAAIVLPEVKESTNKVTKPAVDTDNSSTKILLVEDEPQNRDLIGKMLEALGYNVKTCADAKEATTACNNDTFDLVITDYIMPRSSGLELIKELKEKTAKNSAFLLISGYTTSHNKEGDNDVPRLTKPFDLEMLEKAVQQSLENTLVK